MNDTEAMSAIQQRQCGNKVKHDGLESATAHKEQLEQDVGGRWDVYLCAFCTRYHVGHLRTKAWRRKKRRDAKLLLKGDA